MTKEIIIKFPNSEFKEKFKDDKKAERQYSEYKKEYPAFRIEIRNDNE